MLLDLKPLPSPHPNVFSRDPVGVNVSDGDFYIRSCIAHKKHIFRSGHEKNTFHISAAYE